jgi:hypothetical protein
MLIQSMLKPVGELKELPSSLLAKLVVGQRVESLALTSAVANEVLKLKVQQSIFEIKTPWPIKQGETVSLEVVKSQNNKLALNLIAPESYKVEVAAKAPLSQPSSSTQASKLALGQKIPVQVISTPNNQTVLVSPVLDNVSAAQLSKLPKQIEVDVSRIAKPLQQGDKLALNVVKLEPLSVSISAATTEKSQQQRVVERIKQLLPKQTVTVSKLTSLANSQNKDVLPEKVVNSINQLVNSVVDRPSITQPEKLRQAIQNSGVFLERQLLQQPSSLDNDFRANLQRLIVNLQAAIKTYSQQQATTNLGQQLPAAIQTALATITAAPKELSKIPEHVRQTLISTGVKPAQLLAALLGPSQFQLPEELTLAVEQQRQQQTNSQPLLTNRFLAVELTLLRELLREAESTTTKIQLNQLGMTREAESPTTSNVWMLDVPLKDKQQIDLVQMRIEQNKHNPFNEEGDIWQVDLRIDTVNLGPIHASISMHEQDVKVVINSQLPASRDLLTENMSLLQDNLTALGVTVSHLNCVCEQSDVDINTQLLKQKLVESLVDISV